MPQEPWFWVTSVGQWSTGRTYYSRDELLAMMRELKPYYPLGGRLGQVCPRNEGWAWGDGIFFRYEWQTPLFGRDYMAVWWSLSPPGTPGAVWTRLPLRVKVNMVLPLAIAGTFVALLVMAASRRDPRIDTFVAAARRKLGTPYQWGGGHSPGTWGLDCSGLVIVAAKEAGIPLGAYIPTADGMWRNLPEVSDPSPGDLAFYGSGGKAQHVVIVLEGTPLRTIGANGGDSTTTTPERAQEQGAAVSEKTGHVRRDFLGYGRLLQ